MLNSSKLMLMNLYMLEYMCVWVFINKVLAFIQKYKVSSLSRGKIVRQIRRSDACPESQVRVDASQEEPGSLHSALNQLDCTCTCSSQ